MDSWLQRCSLAALLCSLLLQGSAGDGKNGSLNLEEKNSDKELAAGILHSLLQRGVLDVEKSSARILRSGGGEPFMENKFWGVNKKSKKTPPVQSPVSTGGQESSEGPASQDMKDSSARSQVKGVSSTRSQVKEVSSMRSQDMEDSSTRSQVKEVSSTRSQDMEDFSTRSQVKEVSSRQSQDKEVSMQSQDMEVSSKQKQVKEVSSTQGQDMEVSSIRNQDKEVFSTQSQDKEVSSTQSQVKDVSSTRSQDMEVSSRLSQVKDVSSTQSQDMEVSSTLRRLSHGSGGLTTKKNESLTCIGCDEETYPEKPPSRSLLSEQEADNVESVTDLSWSLGQGTIDLHFRKSLVKGDRPSVTESQEDSGSGDPHVKTLPSQVRDLMDLETSTPSQTSTTSNITPIIPSTEKAISPDSAEIDHLLQVPRETALQPPSSSGSDSWSHKDIEKSDGRSTAQGAQGGTDKTLVTDRPQEEYSSTSVPHDGGLKPSEPPSDLVDMDYNERTDIDDHWRFPKFPGSSFPGGDSTKSIHDKLAPWQKTVHYDDFPTFEDTYFYPTPSFYADGYEEVDIEDDDEDDDLEETDDDDDLTARVVGDVPKTVTLTPKMQAPVVNTKPTGRQDGVFHGELPPRSHPDITRDQSHSLTGTHENGTECRSGYVRRNNSCKSLCDIYPTYCYNGGQCYIVESTGALCRCNTQDYIWHKGLRCESIITDFQVMCVAVGTAALVVLLLFMMTVFFAKKLYLLKTENYKLRKRNRYRTPSELHNDNFSLSTIAEGSHPNEDPNAPQKVQDLPKACLKDEEPFNIQNSLSPKHESGKGDPDIVDVNCVLNNLT